jgi:threonine dehydratase
MNGGTARQKRIMEECRRCLSTGLSDVAGTNPIRDDIVTRMIGVDEIAEARQRLAPHLRCTPLIDSPWLAQISGADVRLKLESQQVSNSFKIRGALNALIRLAGVLDPERRSVVTASAGNHGRAIAWAAERLGLQATVFTPAAAPEAKLGPIRAHGADLRAVADDYEHAERLAIAYAKKTGATFVSAYNHDDVIAGGGTVALDILDDWPEVDTVLVPVGGGGLISGIAAAVKALRPRVRVIGVEAEASGAFTAARRAGHLIAIEVHPTIADGLGGNVEPDSRTWPYVRDLVDDLVTVSEADLHEGLCGLAGHDHLIAEGAGVAAVAAVAARRVRISGSRAAVIVSGANIDVGRLSGILAKPSSR